VESEATTSHLIDQLKPLGVSVSRIALGLPAGSALETADEVTLARALEGRRQV
jgi:recombination protein RecR